MPSGTLDAAALHSACPAGYTKVCEGSAAVLFPPPATAPPQPSRKTTRGDGDGDAQAVFYNPAQVVNRDLSVCALAVYAQQRTAQAHNGDDGKGITVLEALSATGLRAIRYYKEVANIRYIIANDMDADAVTCIRRNCAYNAVPLLTPSLHANVSTATTAASAACGDGSGIIANCDDANALMHRLATMLPRSSPRMCLVAHAAADDKEDKSSSSGSSSSAGRDGGGAATASPHAAQPRLLPLLQQEQMDVVDLDPYGSVAPFLDAALDVVADGGLLLVTSTDSAVLCGNYVGTCLAKYTSAPHKAAHCHEMAVRVVLAAVERAASRRGRYIVPLLSLHIDFYVRCVVRVHVQPAEAKLTGCKLGHYMQCTHCPAYWVRPVVVARAPRHKSTAKTRATTATAAATQQNEHRDEVATTASCPTATFAAPPSRQCEPRLSCPTLAQTLPAACVMPGDDDDDDTTARTCSGSCCPVCGANVVLAGPVYAAATQCPAYIRDMLAVVKARAASGHALAAAARITGLLLTAAEELQDCPLYYDPQALSSYVRARAPATPCLVGALRRLGYRCSQVHCSASGIKTDCPADVLMRVMVQWSRVAVEARSTSEQERQQEADADGARQPKAAVQLTRHCQRPLPTVSFAYDRQYDYRRQATGVVKFVANAPGWGPRRRHRGALHTGDNDEDSDSAMGGVRQHKHHEEEDAAVS